MKKLLKGIVEFRKTVSPEYRQTFSRLALGQSPDSLFIACSDSRVAPNVFASTDPGDLFVVRNVGNMIPPCAPEGSAVADESAAAAIEFALLSLKISSIIVCGHSECGAMQAALAGRRRVDSPHLRSWLRLAQPALEKLRAGSRLEPGLAPHNLLSQLNVLAQVEHLRSYPVVREKLAAGRLSLHAWWFDIAQVEVLAFSSKARRFAAIGE